MTVPTAMRQARPQTSARLPTVPLNFMLSPLRSATPLYARDENAWIACDLLTSTDRVAWHSVGCMNDYWDHERHRQWRASLNQCCRFSGILHPAPRRIEFGEAASIEKVAAMLVTAAKAEGSAVGIYKGVEFGANLGQTAEQVTEEYRRRAANCEASCS